MKWNKRNKIIVFIVLSIILIVGMVLIYTQSRPTYQNPIGEMTDIGDPYVLKVEDQYYMYATSEPHVGFKVWQSDDLVNWEEQVELAYNHELQEDKWAIGDFWAPEVTEYEKQFYMVYSAREYVGSLKIAIAVSDSPLGPFEDVAVDIIPEEGSYIDGHIFIDEGSGQPYLYYVKDNFENIIDGDHVSQVYVREMSDDLLTVEGEETLLLTPDQSWETPYGEYQWNEGPYVLEEEGTYYLMYSANYFASPLYAVGYATADNPLGPFEKAEENPILSEDVENGISGPGHNSVTVGLDNETLYTIYHMHTDPTEPSGDRKVGMDLIYIENGKLIIEGPTYTEQELK